MTCARARANVGSHVPSVGRFFSGGRDEGFTAVHEREWAGQRGI